MMIENRSVPRATIIPVLGYADVGAASDWLCKAFGFRERLRIGTHRCQLVFEDGAVIVTQRQTGQHAVVADEPSHSVHVRVADVDEHYERARRHDARVVEPPADYPYGERQYTVIDPGGHRWTFSQSIADVPPEAWGGTAGDLG